MDEERENDLAAEETMADTEEQTQHETKKPERISTAPFLIWPPTKRTRDAVVNRLVETLSGPSVISKRYGVIPYDEAAAAARRLEDEAFTAAAAAEGGGDGDGLDILQVYSKEISKRVLDAVKARSAAGSAQNGNNASASEEMSSVEMES
ncbi:MFP1 attachment factor like [Actinidia chinensis var. chinensis]|uniref:MFP1 attachment factor like n=1 Tax=Actinidia chinensis var. chinensis TaxID=1590841 RepID=A0A2R6RN56_ACTCC|nr:MFP1 attachment factor like [Actinidia chinensis var. chinensis]